MTVSACGGGGGGGGGAARVFDVFEASASEQSFVDYLNLNTRSDQEKTALRSAVRNFVGGSSSTNSFSSNNDGNSRIVFTNTNYGVNSVTSSPSRLALSFININGDTFDINSDSTTSTQVSGHLDYTSYNIDESNSGGINVIALNSHTSTNADYMVFGYWIYDDDNTWDSSNTQVGAFAHASRASENIADALDYIVTPGSARYEGDVTGIVFTDANTQDAHLSGHVSLRANFGPTVINIRGTISQIQSSNPDIVTVSDITLNQIDSISATLTGGISFRGGTTSASLGGTSLQGKWGGQLFGSEVDRVVGTFSVGAAGSHDIIGAFGAEKE